MTAALTVLPRKSEAEFFRRRICLVVISETVTVFSVSSAVSFILKATLESCWIGCADWWQGVGSIDLKLWCWLAKDILRAWKRYGNALLP